MKEIELTRLFKDDEFIETIYLGGGTPSLLSEQELSKIVEAIGSKFKISDSTEITLEANPDDITAANLDQWKKSGINRLSIGIQSFFDEDLKWMNRAHDSKQAADSIKKSQDKGFRNLTIDLIYGTPTLTDENWKFNVERAIQFGVPHLSCYALTVEPKTALQKMIEKKKAENIDPSQQSRQFLQLCEWTAHAGYEHYEISNFAKPGWKSQHNSSYWQGKPYYGFGPSAHSFDGKNKRSWNISNNALYIQSLQKNLIPSEFEILTPTQRLNEYIMTSLRTSEGMNLDWIRKEFGTESEKKILEDASKFDAEKLFRKEDRLILTLNGKLFADGIASALFQL